MMPHIFLLFGLQMGLDASTPDLGALLSNPGTLGQHGR